MRRGYIVATALVLLLASGTFADVDQAQQFVVNTSNAGSLSGAAAGALASTNMVPVVNVQQSSDGGDNIQLIQTTVGALFQGGAASGLCGLYGFDQGAYAGGSQTQGTTGYFNIGSQDQGFDTLLMQDVFNVGGLGSATAIQNFTGGENQIISTPYGVSANIQCLSIGMLDGSGIEVPVRKDNTHHGVEGLASRQATRGVSGLRGCPMQRP